MFDFTVNKNNSPQDFKYACLRIERFFPDLIKKQLLVDVDGSTIQTYLKDGKDIDVFDDYDVGAVYVKSEVDISVAFQ